MKKYFAFLVITLLACHAFLRLFLIPEGLNVYKTYDPLRGR
jgi:hypothetical protein